MKTYSATLSGVHPVLVEIEIDLSPGLPFFQIVGLPDEVLRESKTRVKSAILQSDFEFPYDSRVVLNLSPSKLKKEGSAFELALASKILMESGQIECPNKDVLFLGELSLDGRVRSVEEISSLIYLANQVELLVLPRIFLENRNFDFACSVLPIDHLKDLKKPRWWEEAKKIQKTKSLSLFFLEEKHSFLKLNFSLFWEEIFLLSMVDDFHILLCGPPGCGKTFFAENLKILKSFYINNVTSEQEILASYFKREALELPWASPHHTSTEAGLIGGGKPPKPGAITRAHGGILFLDELLEFSPSTLDCLREPLERGQVEISRAGYQVSFPSHFQFIAAANPCRCGYWKHPIRQCTCSLASRQNYQLKLSGPLLNRFDIKVFCPAPLGGEAKVKGSTIKQKVDSIKKIAAHKVDWSIDAKNFFDASVLENHMGYRTMDKVRRISVGLCKIDLSFKVSVEHVQKALKYQSLEALSPLH